MRSVITHREVPRASTEKAAVVLISRAAVSHLTMACSAGYSACSPVILGRQAMSGLVRFVQQPPGRPRQHPCCGNSPGALSPCDPAGVVQETRRDAGCQREDRQGPEGQTSSLLGSPAAGACGGDFAEDAEDSRWHGEADVEKAGQETRRAAGRRRGALSTRRAHPRGDSPASSSAQRGQATYPSALPGEQEMNIEQTILVVLGGAAVLALAFTIIDNGARCMCSHIRQGSRGERSRGLRARRLAAISAALLPERAWPPPPCQLPAAVVPWRDSNRFSDSPSRASAATGRQDLRARDNAHAAPPRPVLQASRTP